MPLAGTCDLGAIRRILADRRREAEARLTRAELDAAGLPKLEG